MARVADARTQVAQGALEIEVTGLFSLTSGSLYLFGLEPIIVAGWRSSVGRHFLKLRRGLLATHPQGESIVEVPTGNYIRAYNGWVTDGSPSGGGGGGITGPVSSTDNAIARWNGTAGDTIQNSLVTVDDSGDLSTPGTINGRDVSADGADLDSAVADILTLATAISANIADIATINANNWATNARLRDSGALSVIGRSANSTGDPADISATPASAAVLRESGSVLGFGTVATAGLADDAVTDAKLRDSGALSLIGRSANSGGNPADISASAASGAVLRESGSTLGFGTVATAGIANNAVSNAKIRQGAGLSVIGVTGNATADVADIVGATDGHVLRVSGAALGFGAVGDIVSAYRPGINFAPLNSVPGASGNVRSMINGTMYAAYMGRAWAAWTTILLYWRAASSPGAAGLVYAEVMICTGTWAFNTVTSLTRRGWADISGQLYAAANRSTTISGVSGITAGAHCWLVCGQDNGGTADPQIAASGQVDIMQSGCSQILTAGGQPSAMANGTTFALEANSVNAPRFGWDAS